MSDYFPRRTLNLLLRSLGEEDWAALAPQLSREAFQSGDRVASSSSLMVRVCFPETMVASFGEILEDGSRYEVGMIGREGMIGWPVLLGAAHSQYSGIVQLDGGDGLVMSADALLEICGRRPSLQAAMLRFVQSFTVQMGRTIVASLRDPIEQRLSRWLLMLHDRTDGDELAVTHHALAAALNVRRASVTDCLHILEGERVLRCGRGRMVIRDRRALERSAGETYGAAENSYRKLIGSFGKFPVTG